MAKRKRTVNLEATAAAAETVKSKKMKSTPTTPKSTASKPTTPKSSKAPLIIQIIAGSYDRVLHGITATISTTDTTEFADSFLLEAHQSAIKCLSLSPPSAPKKDSLQKLILATGSTDEVIKLYHLSAHPPAPNALPQIPSLNGKKIIENPQNRSLGELMHHKGGVTALYFPSRSKLMSASEDSTIAVTRTRDWSLLSTIKAPVAKAVGRPSGDTAPVGGTPRGVEDFSVHSSMKLMISVSKGEKSMRLWNLLTGKKAGVLNFGREMLAEIGEGRFGSGEGRKVAWGNTTDGEEFCVGFDRGVLVFGMDSKVKCKVLADGRSKIHQLRYVPVGEEDDMLLAMSTEDGRILFYSTAKENLIEPTTVEGKEPGLSSAKLVAQLGGKAAGVDGRIKDFVILTPSVEEGGEKDTKIVITAGSDGSVRTWILPNKELSSASPPIPKSKTLEAGKEKVKQVGTLIGTTETGNRITCLAAFVMIPRPEGAKDEVIIEEEDVESSGSGSDSDEDE